MRPSGLSSSVRATGVASLMATSLALATLGSASLLAGCSGGGGGSGGGDPENGAPALTVVDIDLDGRDNVSLNTPMVIQFSEYVEPQSIRPDTIQIRQGPRYGIQAFGEFKVSGNIVTFFPRMPTRPDLLDSGFLPKDFMQNYPYHVTILGYPKVDHVAAYTGRPLVRTHVASFSTAASTDPDVFTTLTYKDPPPPAVRFTNPPDVLPTSPWTTTSGAVNVPADAEIAVVLYRVPLLPSSVTASNVTLTMIERYGIAQSRPIQGTPVLDQSFDSVTIRFVPSFPLADEARYVLRMDSRITDLSGQYDLADNANRTAIRTLADSNVDPALTAFAIAHNEEVDPRTFLIFTTRDEPTRDRTAFLNFDGTDLDQNGLNGLDAPATSASFNNNIPGAVAAGFTAAGGTGALGAFAPTSNTTLSSNSATAVAGAFNYDSITINANITLTITGTIPCSLLSLKTITVATNGTILCIGGPGDYAEQNYNTSSLPPSYGGAGNAGGGRGGDAWTGSTYALVRGGSGIDGPNSGGGGGQGGQEPNTTVYGFGGGGGGGGHQFPGADGIKSPGYSSYTSWGGAGGSGGFAGGIQPSSALTSDGKLWSTKGVGAGGGGAGGNSHYYPSSTNWRDTAGGGGGGSGGLLLKSAVDIRIAGRILAQGGKGGDTGSTPGGGYYYYGGPGGGGGGGSIALYANNILDIRGATLDTSGGIGGVPYSSGWQGTGGKGGSGYIQLEAQNTTSAKIVGVTGSGAATFLPGDYFVGTFNPTGTATDAPSVFRSTWFNLGVFDPILQNFAIADFTDQNYPGCTIKYELQMAREDPTAFGKADVSSINLSTGFSSSLAKASQWAVINDPVTGVAGSATTALFNGQHYQFYRIRITYTLKDGQTRSDPVPYTDRFRIRAKY